MPCCSNPKLEEERKQKISKTLIHRLHTWKTRGFTGRHHSEETKLKMSLAQKGHPPYNLGSHHTEETKRKISATLNELYKNPAERVKHISWLGRKHTPEELEKISVANKGSNNPMWGRRNCQDRKNIAEQKLLPSMWQDYLNGLSLKDLSIKYNFSRYAIGIEFEAVGYELRTQKEANQLAGKQGKCIPHMDTHGPNNPNWKGGKRIDEDSGYVMVWVTELQTYRREHHLVWEKVNGPLPEGWCIHHLNGIKTDNRLENLLALQIKSHNNYIPALKKRIRELEVEVSNLQN